MGTRMNVNAAPEMVTQPGRAVLTKQLETLGEWFHNIDLFGVSTAPQHFLGDFPNIKWKHIANSIPADLSGATVLDVGCNGGFYSIEMKKRGASRVLGIDVDDRYLNQARFAAATLGHDIEFQKCSVYNVDQIAGQFDFVIFMGVLYHLRYPLYALDKVITKVRHQLVFQTMLRGDEHLHSAKDDYHFWDTKVFAEPGFPCMYFIEKKYAGDQTNWWIPNRSAAEAMLRSAGLKIMANPEFETWICEPQFAKTNGHYIHDAELEGTL
jgi:tRNA (mo5U34)-methyltransferase